MKTRWKILIVVGIFLALLAASLMVTAHLQPDNALEAYKKTLCDKGEKLEVGEVLPPPVAPEQNCVDAVDLAFGAPGSANVKIPHEMQMVAPGKAMIGWRQPDARGSDFTNSWEDFSAEAATYRPTIELLLQVFDRPKLDFQLDYKKGFTMLLPHLAPFKRTAQVLTAATLCDLHNGDTGAATTNLCTLLALVRGNEDERTIISQLVRIAMLAMAEGANWELLQSTNATDAQLAALQKNWEQMNFFRSAEQSFSMERAMIQDAIEKARASNEDFDRAFAHPVGTPAGGSSWPNLDEVKFGVGKVLWRASWSYTEELHVLRGDQIILETLRTMKTNQFLMADYDSMMSRLSSLGFTNTGEALVRALDIPDFREQFDARSLSGTVKKTMQIEAARRVIVTALALKRFQLKHGKWPETLGELAPELFPSVPIDPFDGKPLRYHPNADGTFLLYCVGEDGVDDGGDSTPASPSMSSTLAGWFWQRARDWVWPQPATPAEVQFFYEHPPK